MMLTSSPRLMSKLMSRRAQKSSVCGTAARGSPVSNPVPRRTSPRALRVMASRNSPCPCRSAAWPITNFLPRPVARMTESPMSDDVGKAALDPSEGPDAEPQEERRHAQADHEAGPVDRAFAADDAPAEAVYDSDHGV